MDEAHEAIKKACSLGLDVGCSWRSLYELERKDLVLAKRYAHKAMKMNANCSSAHRRLGHVYLFEGELDLAMASYAKALSKAKASDAGQSVKEDLG
jgi:Tfp pilus assembly protein PilF